MSDDGNMSDDREMHEEASPMDEQLVLDGNAAAGVLATAFGADVTSAHGRCGHCQTVSVVATLRVYGRGGPGLVLRCPACGGVVVRVVESAGGIRLDRSGLAELELPRDSAG